MKLLPDVKVVKSESNSIQNQKKFLESYARQLKLTNIRHYIDDDESGRFFDCSAYSRMINLALKEEVKEAEKIRKSVYSILRQEQQPHRKQDMER